ncbi:MAG: ABC transporter substrate-binding protein [Opitutaceae bacterium]|nr:ABC transporter substrate-binding protein [Opitutaceae bacterium]NBR57590.1 ABC transporter substrate-binding protein [Opitutaceae bacterium]
MKNPPWLALVSSLTLLASIADAAPTRIRMSINEPLIPQLAVGLGAFAQENLELEVVKVEAVSPEDYLMQEPLVNGRLDASYHWLQHVVFGARHNLPLKAVLMANDTPNMKIMVAARLKDQVKTAADFKGRQIAEGAGYATKSLVTRYLAHQAGLPNNAYHAVLPEVEGRREAVLKGLAENKVDILSFMEPMSSAIADTQQVSTLFDLTTRTGTVRAFGAAWPSHSLFLSTAFIEKNPETVQHLVNALVRALRFANTHTPEEIMARLPAAYFVGKDRDAVLDRIRKTQAGYAQGDYAFPAAGVKLVADAIAWSDFDASAEGRFRAAGVTKFRYEDLYDNRFVEKAMRDIK